MGRKESGGYVGSPYNFVPFTQKVIPYSTDKQPEKAIPAHNAVSEELLSGEITYQIEAMTPIIIDDGKGNFWKNAYGQPAIPGSSIRGLIRANAQVLSLSGMNDDIDDYSLMFRTVAGGSKKMRDRYGNILGAGQIIVNNGKKDTQMSILKKVRAGYLYNENGTYRIYDTGIDRIPINRKDPDGDVLNYYILSERKLAEEYQKTGSKSFAYPFFIKKKGTSVEFKTQYRLDRPFRRNVKETRRGTMTQYIGEANGSYKPYEEPCYYKVTGRNITAVRAFDLSQDLTKQGYLKGYAVSSGFIQMKKAIYIIPEVDKTKKKRFPGDKYEMPLTIPEKDVQAFQVDINKRESTLKTFGGRPHFDLPENPEKPRPVFYIPEGGHLYFGFTPRLRLFYDHTIADGIPASHKTGKIDYQKALFGYADSEKSRKSRISFADARTVTSGNKPDTLGKQMEILSEPKPTSYLDYIVPEKGNGVSYNDKGFQLRGMKQYWLRKETYSNVLKEKEGEEYVSKFYPLPSGTVFEGKVRYHNLKAEELGLLLWSMKLDGKSWMNIGKAKAFGFGNIVLTIKDVKQMNPSSAYDLSSLTLNPFENADADALISEYKESINKKLNGRNIEQLETVQSFFLMKNPDIMPHKDDIRPMRIDKGEYQSRIKPLPTAKEVLGITKAGMVLPGEDHKKSSGVSSGKNSEVQNTRQSSAEAAVPEHAAQDQKQLVKKGQTYSAIVNGTQGKYLKFKVNTDSAPVSSRILCDEIDCETVTKAMLKSLIGKMIEVECTGFTEDSKAIWKCTKINQ